MHLLDMGSAALVVKVSESIMENIDLPSRINQNLYHCTSPFPPASLSAAVHLTDSADVNNVKTI